MQITVNIPDDLAERLGPDVDRRVLEAVALEAYRAEKISEFEAQQLLGFETRYQLDGFLKAHGVFLDYTLDDLKRDQQKLKALGFE